MFAIVTSHAPYGQPVARRQWEWSDPWNGAVMTDSTARAEAYYAAEMHRAAMEGWLEQFDVGNRAGRGACG